MNGYELVAVVVVCVTVLAVVLLWALVRIGQPDHVTAVAEKPAQSRVGQPDLLRRAAEAAQRSGRGREGGL